jgi:hypothetical protein
MSLTIAILAFLTPAGAEADLASPPSITCPRGTTYRRNERRQEYCEPFRCDESGACPSGFRCGEAPLFVEGDRATECHGGACPMVRVCVAPTLDELFPDEPAEPSPPDEPSPSMEVAAEPHEPAGGAAGGCGCAASPTAFGGVAFVIGALALAWVGRKRGQRARP